jgi:hypothetical protein
MNLEVDSSLDDLKQTTHSCCIGLLVHRDREIINVCCFKLINVVIC